MTDNSKKTISEDDLRKHLQKLQSQGMSYRAFAAAYGGPPILFGDIGRILKDRRFPRRADKRLALHLPALVEISACPECGQGHPMKRCPNKPRMIWRTLSDIPTKTFRAMLENRIAY